MKHKSKKLLLCSLTLLAVGTTTTLLAVNNGNGLFSVSGEEAHDWKHYAKVDSTTESIGYKEYWACCGCHQITFTKPATGVSEGTTSSSDIITYLQSNTTDARFLATKPETSVTVNAATGDNWTVIQTDTSHPQIKAEFGQTVGTHTNLLKMRNYQWNDWTEKGLGLTATYDSKDLKLVNNLSFTYYVNHDKKDVASADLNVVISIIDNADKTIQVDSFTISKDETGWINYSKDFGDLNYKKFVIYTKSEFIKLSSGDISTDMYIDNISLKYIDHVTGDVNVNTTDNSLWTQSDSKGDHNEIIVGTNPWIGAGAGSGPYIGLRAYQWSDWAAKPYGVTATYTNNDVKYVNQLNFYYYLNAGSFTANELTLTISIKSSGVAKVVDVIKFNKSTSQQDAVLSYTKNFDNELCFEQLVLTVATSAQEKLSGNTAIFLKEVSAKYIA